MTGPKPFSRILVAALAAGTMLAGAAAAEVPESDEPIKVIVNNWTSQLVLANVAGTLLSGMGYEVEYVPSDTQLQVTAMGNGDMHLQVEVWEGTMRTPFETEVSAGRMADAGSHSAVTREEWWYPAYMEAACPGLPDWEALNGCAALFSTPETGDKGRYLAGPVDWEKPDRQRIEALGMNFEVVNAGQASTLWAELDAAYQREEPIVLFNWTPNWVEARFDGKFVEFPTWGEGCETDPSWGTNPDATYDCGNNANGWLKKGVWAGFAEEWPCAFELVGNIDFTNAMIADAAAMVDVDGMTVEEAAAAWIDANKATVDSWMPACGS
ncbi:MAG: ABC transporter substrate-binding protein [Alphaproteobacteria bacterium]